MDERAKLVEVLTDLVEINNDRVAGYEQAAAQSKDIDADLHTIFHNMANDSRRYAAELTEEVNKLGKRVFRGEAIKGKIYQIWKDLKATFSGYDRQSILESCEFGEDTVQKSYNAALASEIDAQTRVIITNQKAWLKTAHKMVKNYRNAHWKMIA
ncbi:MAG: PA2169 family four-helix-bundle protein [Ferruginibacter sp.]